MSSSKLLLRLVLGLVILVSLSVTPRHIVSAAADDGAQRWEHLALSVEADEGIGDAETSRKIVQLGNDGWELVTVESFVKNGSTTKLVYFFKRPK